MIRGRSDADGGLDVDNHVPDLVELEEFKAGKTFW